MSKRVDHLYSQILLNEMTEEVIDYLNEHRDKLPFDHIFGENDLRVYIPLREEDPTMKEILATLQQIKDYGGVDLEKGEVHRKITLDPKYGGGEKIQKLNIGSAISKLKIPDEDKKKYLNWLALYKDNMAKKSEYGIVLSRAPIDVLRMSDFDGIGSCHSRPGRFSSQRGQYFQCAVQEAITGGSVAYLVRNKEFNGALEYADLQDDDFFDDDERGFSTGLVPLSRLRVRRLRASDEYGEGFEMAIPDTKVYGKTSIPNFYETLKDFLRGKQPMTTEEFSRLDWEKHGGTYYDNDISNLIDSYMDLPRYSSSTPYRNPRHNRSDERDENDRQYELNQLVNNLDSEAEEIRDIYNNRMKYCQVDYYVDMDEDPYLIPSGGCKVVFNIPGLIDAEFETDDASDTRDAMNGQYDGDDNMMWSVLVNHLEGMYYRGTLGSIKYDNGVLTIQFQEEEVYFNSDQYDTFCDRINDFDRKLQRAMDTPNDFIEVFEEIGLLLAPEQEDSLTRLENEGSEDLTYDSSYDDRNVGWSFIITTKKLPDFSGYNIKGEERDIASTFWKMLVNFINRNYKSTIPTGNTQQQSFKNFFESYTTEQYDPSLQKYYIENGEISFNFSYNVIRMYLQLNVNQFNNSNVDLMLFLDKSQGDIVNMARLAFAYSSERFINDDAFFDGLQKAYGKYLY